MKRILLTGGSGLIGSLLGVELVKQGYKLVTLSRSRETAKLNEPFPAERYEWLPDFGIPEAALKEVDTIIHLAGEPIAGQRWSPIQKQRILESRVHSTRAIVSAIKGRQIRLILGSAVGFYGNTGNQWVDSASPKGNGFLADVVSAWEAEVQALLAEKLAVVVRTGVVLADTGGVLQKILPLYQMGLGSRLGLKGDQWFPWIHIEDLLQIFIFLLKNQHASGVYDGVSPGISQQRNFSAEMAKALKVREFLPVPEIFLKAALGEMAELLLHGQRVRPTTILTAGYRFKFDSLEKTLAHLLQDRNSNTQLLTAKQWVAKPIEEVWPYFCSEKNLEKLTPDFLGFSVLRKSTQEIQKGTLIDYQLRLHGLPMKWQTEITDWTPPQRFVDEQLVGPYAKWHHTHTFEPLGTGTLMSDRILYRLPMGRLGYAMASWKVTGDVEKIFRYRRNMIGSIFS